MTDEITELDDEEEPLDPDMGVEDDDDVELTAEEEELEPEEVPPLEPAQSTLSPKQAVPKPEPEKPKVIVDDPYDWYQCQITLAVTWLPREEGKEDREVIVMGRTHDDPPVIHPPVRSGEVLGAEVTEAMENILVSLMGSLEERGKARAGKVAEQKAEAEKRVAEQAKRDAERAERIKSHPQGQAYTPPPAKPSIDYALFKDTDAMNAMNVSETMLKMLEQLVNHGDQDWKTFKAKWKDQPVLELMFAGYIVAEGEKVKLAEKGKATYERALVWKPGEKPVQQETKPPAKGPDPKQTSLF